MLFIACHEFLSCGFQVGGMAGHDHRNGRARPRVFVFFWGGGGHALLRVVSSCAYVGASHHAMHLHISYIRISDDA